MPPSITDFKASARLLKPRVWRANTHEGLHYEKAVPITFSGDCISGTTLDATGSTGSYTVNAGTLEAIRHLRKPARSR
jgi:hypothetical protein